MQKNRNKKEVFSAGYLYHTNFGTFEVFRQISRIYYGSLEIYYGIESNGACVCMHVAIYSNLYPCHNLEELV
jgi:hypothetical protein